jgi:hypothetical protein
MATQSTVKLGFDISDFRKRVAEALGLAKKLENEDPTVTVKVDDDQLDGALGKKDKLDGPVKINVDTKGAEGKISKLGAIAGGALGGAASQGIAALGNKLVQGAQAADDFGDKLEVAFTQQGIADVDAEIEKVRKSTKNLANDLGLPVERTRELAGSVASLGGFTGKSAEDLTKLSAGLEVFTDGAVKGEQVAKAFSRGVADPEGAAAIDALSKKYPQLAETLRSNLSPTEKLAEANKVLGQSFETVKEQQSDAGGILNRLQNELGEIFETVGTQLLDALAPIAQSLLPIIESLLPILQSVLTPLAPILEKIGGLIVEIVQKLAGPLANLLTAVLTPILDLVGMLIEPLKAIVGVALEPLVIVIQAVADALGEFLPQLIKGLSPILPIITGLFVRLTPIIAQVATTLGKLIVAIVNNRAIMLALNLAVGLLAFALDKLVPIIELTVGAIAAIVDAAAQAATYIQNLISAIASFDLGKIKDALLGNAEAADEVKKSTEGAAKATGEQAEAQKALNEEIKKAPPPDAEAAKKYAEALKKAQDALKELNTEQAKQAELLKADTLATEEERAKARLAIEEKYALQALEVERKALTSERELRTAEEAVINKRIEILRADNARRIREIEGKAAADRLKLAAEAEKKVADIQAKLAESALAKLQARFEAGNVALADQIVTAQRAITERTLSDAVDAIVESTPAFVAGAERINRDLLAGIINTDEAKKRTDELRQTITSELLTLPGDTVNPFALQIRDAYDRAAADIVKTTNDVSVKVRAALESIGADTFAESIKGINQALIDADFVTPFAEASRATRELNEEQNKLIESVKAGEVSYQEAAAKFAELEAAKEQQAGATAALIGSVFQTIADQQLAAANDSITRLQELRKAQEDIAAQIVEVERRKNSELDALRLANFESEKLYEEARAAIVAKAEEQTAELKDKETKTATEAAATQEQALAQIGTAAGAAFAGLLAGSQTAGDALKSIVASTVQSLLNLYAPTIIGGFASIIPGPFGIVAGTAAVAALKALVSAAIGSFDTGGYTGDMPTNAVAGVVHGQEYVLNAKATKKHRALAEHLNKGGSLDTFTGAAPMTELQQMRASLNAIRQRLDSMPNGLQSQTQVGVNVGLDTYLYERDRSRMLARRMR